MIWFDVFSIFVHHSPVFRSHAFYHDWQLNHRDVVAVLMGAAAAEVAVVQLAVEPEAAA